MDLDMDPRRVLILPPWALCAYNCPVLGYMPSKKQFDGDIGQYDLHSASRFCALLIPTKVARRFTVRQKNVSLAEVGGENTDDDAGCVYFYTVSLHNIQPASRYT